MKAFSEANEGPWAEWQKKQAQEQWHQADDEVPEGQQRWQSAWKVPV